jgi:hypothetical protein
VIRAASNSSSYSWCTCSEVRASFSFVQLIDQPTNQQRTRDSPLCLPTLLHSAGDMHRAARRAGRVEPERAGVARFSRANWRRRATAVQCADRAAAGRGWRRRKRWPRRRVTASVNRK